MKTILFLFVSIVVLKCTSARSKYVSEEEDNPYEFGFTIDGQQHRHEKKDANGIIQGEFGFITADGVYHVTVYATDENGNFKILSMRNIRVSGPLDQPGATLPDTTKVQQQQPAAGPVANPLAIPGPEPTTTTTTTTTTTEPPTTPKRRGKPACASCEFIEPVTDKNHNLVFQSPAFVNPKPGSLIIGQNNKETNNGQQQGQSGNNDYPNNQQNNYPNGGNNYPNGGSNANPNGGSNYPNGENNYSDNINQTPAFGNDQNYPQNNQNYPQNQQQNYPEDNKYNPQNNQQYNPENNQQYYPQNHDSQEHQQNFPRPGDEQSQLAPNPLQIESFTDAPPTGISVNHDFISVDNNPPIPIVDKYPNMVDGPPPGITKDDISDLLYKFNYTVGFHGHYEKGYKNGAKVGGYFVNDRDGVSRIVTYVADENGYRPKVKFVRLDLNSDLVPKEDTEKTFGLKNFEFVWYPLN